MNPKLGILCVFLSLCMGVLLCASQTHAAKPIAKISSYKGEVLVQSDTKIITVTQIGLPLNDGDRIQTKQGEAQITFNDGALMKIRPFTNTMIQEREEKSGFWIFKTKKAVRRITCFIGKLWFKTGVSKRKNYLQTPTAVCGVRGSNGDIGFDNVNTYLNMYTGEADVVGKVMRGFFADPGIDAATKSRVYESLAKAYEKAKEAKATGKVVDLAQARVEALQVVSTASSVLAENNPDTAVAAEAQVAANVAVANIAAAEAQVAVEQLVEAGADQADITTAQAAATSAQAQAAIANEAADEIYVEGILDPERLDEAITDTETAAENAQSAADEAETIRDDVIPTTEAPPPTTEPAIETTEPAMETTEPAMETTEPAVVTTEPPLVTTVPIIVTTMPPIPTTIPTTTTTTPVVTTTEPVVTTTIPATTTSVPVTTTTTPVETTTVPATTTSVPVTTTTEEASPAM